MADSEENSGGGIWDEATKSSLIVEYESLLRLKAMKTALVASGWPYGLYESGSSVAAITRLRHVQMVEILGII
jgi:hypothetical protein